MKQAKLLKTQMILLKHSVQFQGYAIKHISKDNYHKLLTKEKLEELAIIYRQDAKGLLIGNLTT
jgi:hypothetical protein